MSTTTTLPIQLQVSRLIKAPRERVFAAWTTPDAIMKWLGCGSTYLASAKVDLRVGGAYVFEAKNSECGAKEIRGVYREIKSPSRLVFTWTGGEPGPENPETLVTVDLIDRDGATDVRIKHEFFATEESRDAHNAGWNSCCEKIAKLVE